MGRLSGRLPAWLAGLVLWSLLAAAALAQTLPVPALDAPVVDTTGTLDAASVQVLTQKALALQQRKGSQLQVLVVPTTGGEAIEGYARRVFDQWKLGRAGVDDGVLLLVALEDRRVRIEPGYGLEGAIPDAIANRIIDEYLVPRFRAGDYSGGIDAATTALVGLVDGEALPPPVSGHRREQMAQRDGSPGLMVGVVLGLVAGSFLGGLLRSLPRLVRGGLAGIGAALAGLFLVGGIGVAVAAALVAGLTALIGVTPAVFAGHGGWGRGGSWGGGMGGGGWGGGGGGWGGGGGMSGGGGASGSW